MALSILFSVSQTAATAGASGRSHAGIRHTIEQWLQQAHRLRGNPLSASGKTKSLFGRRFDINPVHCKLCLLYTSDAADD